MTKKKKPTQPKMELPPDVVPKDLEGSKGDEWIPYTELAAMGLDNSVLTFYKTNRFGWVLCTLPISKTRRGSNLNDRTYGIQVQDKKLVTVGKGPHVTAEVVVWLKKDNLERLRKYVDLYHEGLAAAGEVRDRISTRRAQGQQHRAAGRSSWRW